MRITFSTLSSNATSLPSAQPVSSGTSFESLLKTVSTDRRVDSSSTNEGSKNTRTDKSDARSADATASATAGGTLRDDEDSAATAVTAAQDNATTPDATVVESSTVSDAAAGAAADGATFSQALAPSVFVFVDKEITAGSARDAGSGGVESAAAKVPSTDGVAMSVPAKQDRSKLQTDVKSSNTQVTTVVAVVDQSKIPTDNVVSWQSSSHGVKHEALGDTKNGAAGTSAKTQHETASAVDGAAGSTSTAAVVPNSVAGSEAGTAAIVQDGTTEGGFEGLILPAVSGSIPAGNGGGISAIGKSSGKNDAAVDDLAVANVAVDVNGLKAASTGAGDSPMHTSADGNQAAQIDQPNTSKTTAGTNVRGVENANTQGAVPMLSHDSVTSQHTSGTTSDTSRAAKPDNLSAAEHVALGQTTATPGINSAKLLQTLGGTEMHVGMHSEEFGDISIHTSLLQQQMVTQISLAHNDLSQAIATHLSTTQAKLGEEYGLHSSIEIHNQGAPLSGGQGNSSQRDQQTFERSTKGSFVASSALNESGSNVVALTSAGSSHGLDIRV